MEAKRIGRESMRAIIIANGPDQDEPAQPNWVKQDDWILGANGGAARARAWGLLPDVVIGDLDGGEIKRKLVARPHALVEQESNVDLQWMLLNRFHTAAKNFQFGNGLSKKPVAL